MIEYQLLDSGNCRRLERWGKITVSRPDLTADWPATLSFSAWQEAEAVYESQTNQVGSGSWQFSSASSLSEAGFDIKCQLSQDFNPLFFQLKFMPSKHLGLFPEHYSQWLKVQELVASAQFSGSEPFRLLNLFAYTGAASLAAAQAGAKVTHVDSSYEAIGLARESQKISGLDEAPIRWIKEDVMKFAAREARRQNQYDAIILDPPAFGHGTRGESWSTLRDLPGLMKILEQLLSSRAQFLLLNTYALGNLNSAQRMTKKFEESLCVKLSHHQSGVLSLQPQTPNSHLLTTGEYNWWSI